jgi:hypothetical protein
MGERSGKWGKVPGELVRGKCERIRGNLELSGKAESNSRRNARAAWLIYRVPMHFKRNCYEELRTSCATDLRAVIRRHVAIVGPTKRHQRLIPILTALLPRMASIHAKSNEFSLGFSVIKARPPSIRPVHLRRPRWRNGQP